MSAFRLKKDTYYAVGDTLTVLNGTLLFDEKGDIVGTIGIWNAAIDGYPIISYKRPWSGVEAGEPRAKYPEQFGVKDIMGIIKEGPIIEIFNLDGSVRCTYSLTAMP
ncbi:hypothetical protein [Chromobacterium haemolyticum]|uniref:hypothetical protein n=1 Tax=Chromobacterium haemolyticum TaxID=394935 RepID=UPI0009D9E3D7|nr:hypothetical protein [Chromobacterium haemolyticum]OQS44867.1 hypothetical protein B0T39_01065 [Chromobacterium haemolyticum]